jgi:hypothetical protein
VVEAAAANDAQGQNATLGRMVLAKIKEMPPGVEALKTRGVKTETGETTGSEEKGHGQGAMILFFKQSISTVMAASPKKNWLMPCKLFENWIVMVTDR